MNLAHVAARLRPRTPYEAIDLGFALARRFWKPLMIAWLACVLPLVLGAAVVAVTTTLFWLPLFFIWWLKPLFGRPALFVLSRAFFGDVPDLKRTLDHTMKAWRSGSALADLTWRRFSPYRGVSMPVRELEQLGGSAARERLKLLLRTGMQGPAFWLLGVLMATEVVLLAAGVALLAMVLPQTVDFDLFYQLEMLFETSYNDPVTEAGVFVLYFLAMSVVEIFYIAASFGMYINRRVRLEGWDIEIVFRKLAARLAARSRSAARTAAAVLLAIFVGVSAAPAPVVAQQYEPAQPEQRPSEQNPSEQNPSDQNSSDQNERPDPQKVVEEVLDAPEFGTSSTETEWRVKEALFEREEREERETPSFLDGLGASIAGIVKILMWLVAGAAVIAAIVYFMRLVRRPGRSTRPAEQRVVAPTEFEEVEEPTRVRLPADLVETAVARWEAGAHAESLSLLYRGTIRGLAQGYRIEIDPSYTAYECVGKVREAGGPADYVAELAAAWTATVYAGRRPDDARARELFAAWRRHFRAGPSRKEPLREERA